MLRFVCVMRESHGAECHAVFPLLCEGMPECVKWSVCVRAHWHFCKRLIQFVVSVLWFVQENPLYLLCITHLILLSNITELYHVNKIMYRDLNIVWCIYIKGYNKATPPPCCSHPKCVKVRKRLILCCTSHHPYLQKINFILFNNSSEIYKSPCGQLNYINSSMRILQRSTWK